MPKIPFTDREGAAVPLVARRTVEKTIIESSRAPWIGGMIRSGVRAESSRSGRVCWAVGLWNSPKLSAKKFSQNQ